MRKFTISMASSRSATNWPRKEISWDDFLGKIKNPVRGKETQDEYLKMPKTEQDNLKDVGGFVGGCMEGDRRLKSKVEKRSMITLDFDDIPSYKTDDVIARVTCLGCMSAVYSTRKHRPAYPRLRVIIPLDRDCSADEYEAIARKAASLIGIDMCDPVSFRPNQLMHWPSCSADGEYICESLEGPLCKVNGILGMYGDWHDVSEWPITVRENKKTDREAKKQGDPTEKKGVVGAFCRAYDIYGAMEKFLPGVYTPTDVDDRYTYVEGSTSGGALVYQNGLFLFSHHTTDPCSQTLVNAFDLVRLHKYGALDDEAPEGTRVSSLPSFKAMADFAYQDDRVRALRAREEEAVLAEAFKETSVATGDEYDPEWRSLLEVDAKGAYLGTVNNICLIIRNDVNLRGRIWLDEFSGMMTVKGPMPWDAVGTPSDERIWSDNDDNGLLWYVETFYTKMVGPTRICASVSLESARSKRNPVKEYLNSLTWDGVKRLERLFVKYLGASDTEYVREVTRKMFAAAVYRVMQPGTKFDNMIILVGDQGLGKSTIFKKLGMKWFTDSLTSFDGKDASELIQGVWIVEVGELTAMNKQESNAVKQFLSKTDDRYRSAYGRRTGVHARTCIFVGTSNDSEFLKDTTGNRRFWPVEVGERDPEASVFEDLSQEDVDQVWAEAMMYYRLGESLYLSKRVEAMAIERQEEHQIRNGKEGIVEEFLNRLIPTNWYEMSDMERKQFLNGNLSVPPEMLVERRRVCPVEIWVYCFGKNPGSMQRFDTLEINQIIHNIPGWKISSNGMRFGNLGRGRGFVTLV